MEKGCQIIFSRLTQASRFSSSYSSSKSKGSRGFHLKTRRGWSSGKIWVGFQAALCKVDQPLKAEDKLVESHPRPIRGWRELMVSITRAMVLSQTISSLKGSQLMSSISRVAKKGDQTLSITSWVIKTLPTSSRIQIRNELLVTHLESSLEIWQPSQVWIRTELH